ncbi:MAG: type II secretion system major pseudopilin GspG [Deltaproteobacteria bacterium]|nr:type II secretion system major pseudopilin GspG [Deltaproteobacteria bacterium]
MILTHKNSSGVAVSNLEARSSKQDRNPLWGFNVPAPGLQLPAWTQRRGFPFFESAGKKGFTLIEIMVVIVILGILAMYVAPKLMGRPEEAKQVRAKMDIAALETALKLYKLDSGIYPGTEQGLQALVQRPESGVIPKKWRQGGYLEKGKVPKDPWSNDYIYLSPGLKAEFDIISYGADGVPGGENENKDINNWDVD